MLKKEFKNRFFFLLLSILFFFVACDKIEDFEKEENQPEDATISKMYVLSEGSFNQNNSSLAYYDFDSKELDRNYFLTKNKRGLGDTANDMQQYGSKLYIVVNVSSQIEVVDIKTGVSIKRISMFNEADIAREPRYIDFYEGKAYVCSFDGTVAKIDTISLEIESFVKVGFNPDGICIANKKIYVANSGGLSFPNYDNTVSVIDIASFTEIKKIEVGLNPYKIHSDSQGDVYVVTRGNYNDIAYQFHRIDSSSDEKVQTFDGLTTYNFEIHNDTAYMYYYEFSTGNKWIKLFDCLQERIIDEEFIKDDTNIVSPYGFAINPVSRDVYVFDARNFTKLGDVLCFSPNGELKYRINEIGLNPNHIVFVP